MQQRTRRQSERVPASGGSGGGGGPPHRGGAGEARKADEMTLDVSAKSGPASSALWPRRSCSRSRASGSAGSVKQRQFNELLAPARRALPTSGDAGGKVFDAGGKVCDLVCMEPSGFSVYPASVCMQA